MSVRHRTRYRLLPAAALSAVIPAFCAQAADLSEQPGYKDEPIVSIGAYSWTGFYGGISVGGETYKNKWETTGFGIPVPPDATALQRNTEDAVTVGGYAGYNYQLEGRFLIGIEGGIEGNSTSTKTIASFIPGTSNYPTTDKVSEDVEFGASIRGRLGVLISPKVLIYGTGGVAFQQAKYNVACGSANAGNPNGWCFDPERGSQTEFLTGWTAGGGIEAQISAHWLVRGELQFSDFGHQNLTFFPGGNGGLDKITSRVALQSETAKIGLTYKFSPAAADFDDVGGGLKDAPFRALADWSGFYAGVNFGYGVDANPTDRSFSDSGVFFIFPFSDTGQTSGLDRSGVFGGGQIGYNVQKGVFVFGAEADLQGSGIGDRNGSLGTLTIAPVSFPQPYSDKGNIGYFGTVRARLGYAYDNALFYVTGGFAFGEVKETITFPGLFLQTMKRDNVDTGYALGAGVEYKLGGAWSVKAEYQYIDLGSHALSASYNDSAGDSEVIRTNAISNSIHTARIGLNYHLGGEYEPLK